MFAYPFVLAHVPGGTPSMGAPDLRRPGEWMRNPQYHIYVREKTTVRVEGKMVGKFVCRIHFVCPGWRTSDEEAFVIRDVVMKPPVRKEILIIHPLLFSSNFFVVSYLLYLHHSEFVRRSCPPPDISCRPSSLSPNKTLGWSVPPQSGTGEGRAVVFVCIHFCSRSFYGSPIVCGCLSNRGGDVCMTCVCDDRYWMMIPR
jgi:hypothetical protein